MPLRADMEVREYLDIFLRRKWFVIFVILGGIFGASVYCVVMPNQYQSATTIMLIPQSVPENYVRPTATLRIEDKLTTIKQQVMSRSRLERVVKELGLFGKKLKKASMDDIMDTMRKRIDVQVRGRDLFTLTFIYEDPRLAMLATSLLTSLFIEDNLKTREHQTVGTSNFFQTQLEQTQRELENHEARIKKYKLENAGELPLQLQTNINTLMRRQDQLRANSDTIRVAEDRKYALEAQLMGMDGAMPGTVIVGGRTERVVAQDPAQQLMMDYSAKKAALRDMQIKYTDQYPAIPRLKREVELLERRIMEVRQSASVSDNAASRATVGAQPLERSIESQEARRLRTLIKSSEQELASLREEHKKIQQGIDEVQAKVDQAPMREQEMIPLTRDYENLKRSYDDLKRKKLDADIAQNLERRQKGEQYQILEAAIVAEKPIYPNPFKAYLLGTLLACLVGFGGAIGAEMRDPTLKNAKEFKSFCKIPILAGIAVIQDRARVRKQAIRKTILLGVILSGIAGVTIYLVIFGDQVKRILFT